MKKKMNDYLEHHGVEGQKWGVKHGPPYPIEKRSKASYDNYRRFKKKNVAIYAILAGAGLITTTALKNVTNKVVDKAWKKYVKP